MWNNDLIITAVRIILVTAGVTNLFSPSVHKAQKDSQFSVFYSMLKKILISISIIILGIYLKVIIIAFMKSP